MGKLLVEFPATITVDEPVILSELVLVVPICVPSIKNLRFVPDLDTLT
jgi:hypothetical protein